MDVNNPPYEVAVYASIRKGNHKIYLSIWKGFSINEGLVHYKMALDLIRMVSKEGVQVLLRGPDRWYHRATLENWKFKEDVRQ